MNNDGDYSTIETGSNFIECPLYMHVQFKRSSTSCSRSDQGTQMAHPHLQHSSWLSTARKCSRAAVSPPPPLPPRLMTPAAVNVIPHDRVSIISHPPPLPPRTSPIPSQSPFSAASRIRSHSLHNPCFHPKSGTFPLTLPNGVPSPLGSSHPHCPSQSVDFPTSLPTPLPSLPGHTLILTNSLCPHSTVPPHHSPTHCMHSLPYCSPDSTDLSPLSLPPCSSLHLKSSPYTVCSIPHHHSASTGSDTPPVTSRASLPLNPTQPLIPLDSRPSISHRSLGPFIMPSAPSQAPLTDECTNKVKSPLLSQSPKKPHVFAKSYSDMYTRSLPTYKQPQPYPSDNYVHQTCEDGESQQEPSEDEYIEISVAQEDEYVGLVRSKCLPLTQKNEYTLFCPAMTQEENGLEQLCSNCLSMTQEGKRIELVHSNCSSGTKEGEYLELIHSNLPSASQLSQQADSPSLASKLSHHSSTKNIMNQTTGARAYLHQSVANRAPSRDTTVFTQHARSSSVPQRMVSASPPATESPSSHSAYVNTSNSNVWLVRKDGLSKTKALSNSSCATAPSRCEKWTPLLVYDTSEDSDSDNDGYVVPDSEFQPKRNDCSQHKDTTMRKMEYAKRSEEGKEKGFIPTLGAGHHLAEERRKQQCGDAYKNSWQ